MGDSPTDQNSPGGSHKLNQLGGWEEGDGKTIAY